jgi:hypothetical protein
MASMKSTVLIATAVLLAAFAPAIIAAPAQAKSMTECAAQWRDMKAAGQTSGVKYRDFSKQCMSGKAPAAEAAPPPEPDASPAPSPRHTKAASGGKAAWLARLHACSADWKSAKASGSTGGQKWPQFYSACNKRKKAEGM